MAGVSVGRQISRGGRDRSDRTFEVRWPPGHGRGCGPHRSPWLGHLQSHHRNDVQVDGFVSR